MYLWIPLMAVWLRASSLERLTSLSLLSIHAYILQKATSNAVWLLCAQSPCSWFVPWLWLSEGQSNPSYVNLHALTLQSRRYFSLLLLLFTESIFQVDLTLQGLDLTQNSQTFLVGRVPSWNSLYLKCYTNSCSHQCETQFVLHWRHHWKYVKLAI